MLTPNNSTPAGNLAVAIVVGFFGTLTGLMFVDVGPAMKDPLLLMLGALIGAFGMVVSFHFGTTAANRMKDDTIKVLSQTASVATDTAQASQAAAAVTAGVQGPPIQVDTLQVDAAGASITIDKGKS